MSHAHRTLPPLIYIAGPYTAPTPEETDKNIEEIAVYVGAVARLGCMPVAPHLATNTPHVRQAPAGSFGKRGQTDAEFWYDATLALMRACHGLLLTPRWKDSSGSRREAAEAVEIRMPTFFCVEDLEDYLRRRDLLP